MSDQLTDLRTHLKERFERCHPEYRCGEPDFMGPFDAPPDKPSLQWVWRTKPKRPFIWQEATSAVLEALVMYGSCIAWDGDGVGCVVQMIHAQWERAEKAEAELKKLKESLEDGR